MRYPAARPGRPHWCGESGGLGLPVGLVSGEARAGLVGGFRAGNVVQARGVETRGRAIFKNRVVVFRCPGGGIKRAVAVNHQKMSTRVPQIVIGAEADQPRGGEPVPRQVCCPSAIVAAHPVHGSCEWIGLLTEVQDGLVIAEVMVDVLARVSVRLHHPDDERLQFMAAAIDSLSKSRIVHRAPDFKVLSNIRALSARSAVGQPHAVLRAGQRDQAGLTWASRGRLHCHSSTPRLNSETLRQTVPADAVNSCRGVVLVIIAKREISS